jgi:lincosamide and streptogramin A transport system ATP-binding/permease protein
MIEKEFCELSMNSDLLKRNFDSLSGGEQTKALLVSLFLKKNNFNLIDEPANHLDMEGRQILGEYLLKKKGFILVSHDRYFLDLCVDHILSINKNDVKVSKGNYSQWRYNAVLEDEFEKRKSENLKREIKSLETAARKRRQWSDKKEIEITGASDKGFVSHRSAKLMKRALSLESRRENRLEEKKALLKNYEKERNLKLEKKEESTNKILSISNAGLKLGDKVILNDFSMTVNYGDRVAIIGGNGCGKTTLIKVILKELKLDEGLLFKPNFITISYARQNPFWDKGFLREYLRVEKIDETKFRNIMGVLGVSGKLFERPMESFSKGEIKKIELCKSFLEPCDLLIWDEPLNYLDVMSREQIERVILKNKPTLIFTEHDRVFIKKIASQVIKLN